jgi:hypothetical protein
VKDWEQYGGGAKRKKGGVSGRKSRNEGPESGRARKWGRDKVPEQGTSQSTGNNRE